MPRIGVREWLAVGRVIAHGDLLRTSTGLQVCRRFERELAAAMGTRHALAVSSGTAALVVALQACGIGPGDEVLVSAYTWKASAAAVLLAGAVPVLVEIDATLTMDPEDLRAKITPRSRAVIPVHMINRPCDMDAILAIARAHGLRVIEDAAQGVGLRYKGRACGAMGDIGCLSFNQYKNMTCGEGGAILTNDDRLFERAYCAHDLGVDFRDLEHAPTEASFVGANYRISEIQGAILRVQLSKLHGRLARMRRRVAAMGRILTDAGLPVAPLTDAGGAQSLAVTFATEAEAADFARHRGVRRLYDNSKHVYTAWHAILERRMAHPGLDPWAWAGGNSYLHADSCPRTLDILRRSCAVSSLEDYPYPVALMVARKLAQAAPRAA